jgi:hypothetical protein
MPEYTLAALAILGVGVLAAAVRGVLGEPAVLGGLVVFGAATVIADVVLTGLPIVTYDDAARSCLAIGPMPLEDLAYGLALYLVAAAAWGRPHRRARAPA